MISFALPTHRDCTNRTTSAPPSSPAHDCKCKCACACGAATATSTTTTTNNVIYCMSQGRTVPSVGGRTALPSSQQRALSTGWSRRLRRRPSQLESVETYDGILFVYFNGCSCIMATRKLLVRERPEYETFCAGEKSRWNQKQKHKMIDFPPPLSWHSLPSGVALHPFPITVQSRVGTQQQQLRQTDSQGESCCSWLKAHEGGFREEGYKLFFSLLLLLLLSCGAHSRPSRRRVHDLCHW